MQIDYLGLAKRIAEFRKDRGFTQEELAERAALSPHYVGNIEQGVRKPSLNAVAKLCHALGVTFDQLFADSLTDEMAAGISVYLQDENKLREAPSAFWDELLPLFDWDEEEDSSSFALETWPQIEIEESPRPISLSDLIL